MDTTSNRFEVVLMEQQDRATGKGTTIYKGDDADAANKATQEAKADPANAGRIVRVYDFTLFGGGIRDHNVLAK